MVILLQQAPRTFGVILDKVCCTHSDNIKLKTITIIKKLTQDIRKIFERKSRRDILKL